MKTATIKIVTSEDLFTREIAKAIEIAYPLSYNTGFQLNKFEPGTHCYIKIQVVK